MRKKRKSETEVTFRIQTNQRSTRFTGRTRSARATKRETFVSETRRAVVQTIPVCTYGRLPRLYDRTLHGEARHAPRVASLPTASPTRETSTRVESRASRRALKRVSRKTKSRRRGGFDSSRDVPVPPLGGGSYKKMRAPSSVRVHPGGTRGSTPPIRALRRGIDVSPNPEDVLSGRPRRVSCPSAGPSARPRRARRRARRPRRHRRRLAPPRRR